MQNNKINAENIDESDDYIQSLDINQLRQLEKNSTFLFSNEPLNVPADDQFYLEIDDYIQSLQLSELKEIENNSQLLKNISQSTIKHKSKITGLDERIIILIETKREKATLEQLMIYCNKLHVPYQKIIPEFFQQYR
jgi:hypothetical protein